MNKKLYLLTSLVICIPCVYAEKNQVAAEHQAKNTEPIDSIWLELDRMHEEFKQLHSHMDEMMESFWRNDTMRLPSTYSLGLEEKDNNLIARVTLPGMNPESVNVTIEDDVLRIAGSREERTQDQGDKKGKVIKSNRFNIVRTLPYSVIAESTKADYEGEVLTITMPKAAEKSKTIKITKK